jgi:hypothetical protein
MKALTAQKRLATQEAPTPLEAIPLTEATILAGAACG